MDSKQHPAVCIGIDWADQEHALCLIDPAHPERPEHQQLPQQPEAIEAWVAGLRERFPGQAIAICLEQSKGALIHALMKHECLVLYPINPKQLARFRDALSPSGAKDDPADAELLALFWQHHHEHLRAWRPDDSKTRQLAILVEDRRRLVERRVELTNGLKDRLKQYFPLALEMLGSLDSPLACDFLLRFGSLAQLQAASPEEIADVYRSGRCWHPQLIAARLEKVSQAVPLTEDSAIVTGGEMLVRSLSEQLQVVLAAIARYEVQIKELMQRHDDAALFESLPGAGDALAPRLLVAFGSDRERFDSAQQVQEYAGIAPVTRRSGKQCVVSQRWACNKFLKQTFHEFAHHSYRRCVWAQAYYRLQRDRGKNHQAAIRALAFKWIRILHRCWKTRTCYDELVYYEKLRKRNSPLLKYINQSHK
jgi:transposase